MVLSMAAIRFANRSFVKFFSRWFTALNLLPSIATALPSSRCRPGRVRRSGSKPCGWPGRCRAEVRGEAARQPDQLEIAPALAFEPARGLDLIEIAVQVDLEQGRRMIAGTARRLGRDTIKAKLRQIERINKGIDHPHRIVGADVVVQ